MNFKKYIIHNLLFIILIIAAVLRLWKLDSIPPSLTSDEAALGYNAYSILKTGKDEYGKLLPVIFKSFGDYKPGLYVYLTVPFVAVFGLNEFSTRLPSSLAGVIAVWLLYKIVIDFKKREKLEVGNRKASTITSLEILAPAMLAISPWHIHFSRGAWEVNVALTLTLAAIWYFIKALRNSKYLIYSAVCFTLTLLTYQGAKLSSAIVLALLLLIYWKKFWSAFRAHAGPVLVSGVLGILISLPIFLSLINGQTGRLNVFSVFSYPRKDSDIVQILSQGNETNNSLSYYLFHSETLNFKRGILGRWFNHFSGRFLFFEGDWQNPRHSAPNQGMMLMSDFIFLTFGLLFIAKNIRTGWAKFMVLWLLLAPLPSVLSRDAVHAVRAYNMVIPLTIVTSCGIYYLFSLVKHKSAISKVVVTKLTVLMFVASFIYFLDAYFVHLPKHDSEAWDYGYKELVKTITPLQNHYDDIKVQQSFSQPYIYFLFYQKYDPAKYQKTAKLTASEYAGDVGYVEKLDNIYFAPIDWPQNKQEHGILVAADEIRIPDFEIAAGGAFGLIKSIKYLDGNTAFNVVEIK
jgi:4-amino-4-deoxy-L-arabinose transferase-like glycosyltransferase